MKTTWSGHTVEVVAVRRDVVAVPVGLEPDEDWRLTDFTVDSVTELDLVEVTAPGMGPLTMVVHPSELAAWAHLPSRAAAERRAR
jgi:hypothetical protein